MIIHYLLRIKYRTKHIFFKIYSKNFQKKKNGTIIDCSIQGRF
nr:MAG TPA: hypothetical protein [Ackermannviridae sp.]